ncbi:hypothetical protein SFRURICE_004673 [Spodoptera frugiperda]|nr:hypothetical protein SFRURICE_004673 [Spodoptera frugiperda]
MLHYQITQEYDLDKTPHSKYDDSKFHPLNPINVTEIIPPKDPWPAADDHDQGHDLTNDIFMDGWKDILSERLKYCDL